MGFDYVDGLSQGLWTKPLNQFITHSFGEGGNALGDESVAPDLVFWGEEREEFVPVEVVVMEDVCVAGWHEGCERSGRAVGEDF